MTEEVFLKNLLEKRLKWVEASRENDFEEGIQRLLTDLYPDTAHFIFELLQNAEDAQSTHVLFDLKKDVLTVTHNGKRLFNNKDVESITSIAVSTKKDDITQIGKFGIGFKAVFAYTKSPCIYSVEFAFKIRDLVCPQPIENILSDKANTIFEFPFDQQGPGQIHIICCLPNRLIQIPRLRMLP
ncbi:MAG: ATP-binding protein [Nitrospirae bacterium]|nr:ATP-binding protein [Nitrospirota bacterium]